MAENNKTADSHGVAALPDVGADARVNVTDVGGIAGVGVDGDGDVGDSSGRTVHQEVDTVGGEVLNDEPEHMEVDEVQRTDDSGPTKTWGDGGRQHAPVTPEASPKNSGITHKALQILGDPLADIKSVDVEAPLKQETGPPTSTWGKDEFHVRSDGGVTNEIGNLGGPIGENLPEASEATHGSPDTSGGNLGGPIGDNAADSGAAKHHAPVTKGTSVNTHIFKAFRVAETETALGIIDPDMKIDRAQELADSETPEQLDARLDTYSKVRTAGLRRTPRPTTRQASVMPSLQRFEIVAAAEAEIDEDATGIFY